MQTLHTGCSKAEPKILPRCSSRGRKMAKINRLEMVTTFTSEMTYTVSSGTLNLSIPYLHLQTQFGEDQCTQFRVIMVTDPQTNKHK